MTAAASPAAALDPATSTRLALDSAFRALEKGDSSEARVLAQSALLAAKAQADLSMEAQALACLAHCDRVMARLRRAGDTSRRAAALFERLGQKEGEAGALRTLAHVSMLLGRNDEAIEAALLSSKLCNLHTPTEESALALNCIGIAYCWGGDFERASQSLEAAVALSARCTPPLSPYQPRMNQVLVEALHIAEERYLRGRLPSLRVMGQLVKECRRLERLEGNALPPGLQALGITVSEVLKGLYAVWSGQQESAQTYAERAVGSLSGSVTWLDALVRWTLGELAWSVGDFEGARAAFEEMKSLAVSVEHERLACLAHLLLIQLLEAQGEHEAAAFEYRALRVRERKVAIESMGSREAVVQGQMGARLSERHLAEARAAARQFERWSLEDPLTGIANRRSFEIELAARLAGATARGGDLTVAMIDLDRFKLVNDMHGHQVGDRVLKTVAGLLAEHVRAGDLPARLAGDEFVILFADADEDVAGIVCARIQIAVKNFAWDSIAAGLEVGLSIGLSKAVTGDTADTLIHRSDTSMYVAKTGWMPTGE